MIFLCVNASHALIKQCYVCHNTSPMWFLQRSEQIKSFQKAKTQKDRLGHVWLRTQDINQVVSKLKPIAKQKKGSFYQEFQGAIDKKNKDKALKLIQEAKVDVPKFELIWNKLSLHIQENQFEHPSFKKAVKTLFFPYYYLNLDMQQHAKYEASSNINLKKVFLIFGGFRNTIKSVLKASFSDKFHILDVKGDTSKNYKFEGLFEYTLNQYGTLSSFQNKTNVSNTYLKNLSSAFARPQHLNFENYTGIKRVYMTPSKFFKKDHLDLQVKFSYESLQLEDDLPLLKLNFTLQEQAKDKRDSLQVFGKGSVLMFPWGVVKDYKTQVRFKFKALGFNLFRGRVSEQLKYVQ